jgi:TatD DNase family protein
MPIELIDTHAHLQSDEFDDDREHVLQRARDAGIKKIIIIGSSRGWDSAYQAIELVAKHDFLWAAVGIHPNSADTPFDGQKLRSLAASSKVVAIGESGLDYFRHPETADLQKKWLREHIAVAKEVHKPIIIHSRDAGEDCLEILQNESAAEAGGVFHCFAENAEFAKKLAAINFMVSFPGIATFKTAQSLRDTIKSIPLEQILLETDSPYLAPVPYRGKRCESAFMVETAKVIAQVKDVSLEELAAITCANAERLFRLG